MEGLTFEQTPSAPIVTPRERSPKRFFYLLATIAVAGLLLFGLFRILGSSNEPKKAEITPTPTEFITEAPTETPTEAKETPTPTKTPTPTANPVDSATGLDRSTLSIEVLNGSGITGVAASARDYLESLGYNVISIGNAENSDFQNVTIQVKSTQSNFLALLSKDLSAKYTVGATSSDLSATSSAEALVVIGK
ncbi:MAG: LytR C-terminal domain-containing protein [Candidatus Levybacteria bacterium]|nr:LytR C-terminal domain-containing protein [Candidatus Levybacteria bacterium]